GCPACVRERATRAPWHGKQNSRDQTVIVAEPMPVGPPSHPGVAADQGGGPSARRRPRGDRAGYGHRPITPSWPSPGILTRGSDSAIPKGRVTARNCFFRAAGTRGDGRVDPRDEPGDGHDGMGGDRAPT